MDRAGSSPKKRARTDDDGARKHKQQFHEIYKEVVALGELLALLVVPTQYVWEANSWCRCLGASTFTGKQKKVWEAKEYGALGAKVR
jgi:hypothetical protein